MCKDALVRSDRLLSTLLLLAFFSMPGTALAAERTDQNLLAGADLFAQAPAAFRMALAVGAEGAPARSQMEIYRRGRDLAVIRLLDKKDLGKYFLKRGPDLWFFSPGAKQPVRLGPGYKLAGASLDEILGLSFARDYQLTGAVRANGVATLDLEAVAASASYPKARLALAVATGLPLRIELRTREGKVLRIVEIPKWRDATKRIPAELVLKDLVRGGAPLRLEFLALEARDLPESFFALDAVGLRQREFAISRPVLDSRALR